MSTIGPVDIQDWERNIHTARQCVDSLDDYSKMEIGVDPYGAREYLEKFISQVESLIQGNQQQVAALFLPKKE